MKLTFTNLPNNISYSYSEERVEHIFEYKNGKDHIGVGFKNNSPVITDNTPDELVEKVKLAFDKHLYNVEHGIEEEVDINKLNNLDKSSNRYPDVPCAHGVNVNLPC